ncbi:MAG: head GIN domain-containing protein [Cyclobacteriaceae bacterium]
MIKKIAVFLLVVTVGALSAQAQKRETRKTDNFTKVAFRIPGKLYLKQGSSNSVELSGDPEVLDRIETRVDGSKLVIGMEDRWFNWNWKDQDRITAYVTVKSLEGVSVSGSGDVVGEGRFNAENVALAVSGSGSLTIEMDARKVEANVSGSGDINLSGRFADLDSEISGSGKVILDAQVAGAVEVGISGSGRLQAKGLAQRLEAHISGSGKVYAADMEVDSCEAKISGSGDVEIAVKTSIDATISGSGTVAYRGNPGHINSHSSGSGKVRKL